MNNKELGIYVHIPFCKQKCYYCDFISFANKCDIIPEYIETLEKEIDTYDFSKENVTTIYIGGGTPSFVPSKDIVKILEKLKQKLNKNKTKWEEIEITIEVNPGTATYEALSDYKKVGINRLSIGLQSSNDNRLKQIGRVHTRQEFIDTYNMAEEIGFKNKNVDLMIGLPEQTIEEIKEDLDFVINLKPAHISVYSLIVEEGTKIEKMISNGKMELPEEELERNMYWYVKNTLELNGYIHYEISNFARKGKESKHNINCWEQKEYIGVGVSAHSYFNNIRYGNTNDLQKYINFNWKNYKEAEKKGIRIIEEIQTIEEKQKEYMLLSLRKIEGVSIQKFKEKYVENPIFLFRKELEKLVEEELLTIDGDKIKLTNRGLDLANLVWEEFV